MNKKIVYIALCLFFLSCNQAFEKDDYIAWVESQENGVKNSRELDGFIYTIQYKPVPYILAKKNRANSKVSDYDDLHYIDLELTHEKYPEFMKLGLVNREDYYHRLKYYSFDIKEDLKLIDGQDTLKCVFNHYERTYGIRPGLKIVLAFEKNAESIEDLVFSYNDVIFNKGIVNIKIKNEALRNIPELKI